MSRKGVSMAKATKTIKQPLRYKAAHASWFVATKTLFNQVAAFYFEVIQAHPSILDLSSKEALTALDNFRGIAEPMPLYSGISAIIFFAAMGLPGLCGFPGEFMVVLATWSFNPWFAVIAAMTVVLTAAYILWTLQRVFLGANPAYKAFPDISLRELSCAVPLVIFAVLLGVVPAIVFSWMEPSVSGLVQQLFQLTASP